jgi:hypothetical protein
MDKRVPGKSLADAKVDYPPEEFVIVKPEEVECAERDLVVCPQHKGD